MAQSEHKKARVYFTDMRTTDELTLPRKLENLMRAAGFETIDFDRQFAAIKMHLGEPGNIAYLRPNYAKVVADYVKKLGGKPFLTDCNTLYVGRRKDALEHLDAAYENGFNPFCTGCQVIIADGLKGTDEAFVPVVGGEYVKEAKIGRAIMDADVVISLTHFKGHCQTGFGGAIKNLGMGSGSRAGKFEMHESGAVEIDPDKCVGCGRCAVACAHDAINLSGGKAAVDEAKCAGCSRCLPRCPFDAIGAKWSESAEMLCRKMAEYAKAVVDGRPAFHVSLAVDISPNCDCELSNDAAIVPNIGMFASFDPVAIDQACADAVSKAPVIAGSRLEEKLAASPHDDRFHALFPNTRWQEALEHCEKIGLGTRSYDLVIL